MASFELDVSSSSRSTSPGTPTSASLIQSPPKKTGQTSKTNGKKAGPLPKKAASPPRPPPPPVRAPEPDFIGQSITKIMSTSTEELFLRCRRGGDGFVNWHVGEFLRYHCWYWQSGNWMALSAVLRRTLTCISFLVISFILYNSPTQSHIQYQAGLYEIPH